MDSETGNPGGFIGRALPRPNIRRLTQGRGQYVSDVMLPRMAHAAFLRSPYAHAAIARVDVAPARAMPGVLAVLDGRAMAALCTPWVGVLTHMRGLKSAPQHPLAIDRVRWQGEPVAIVVATTRAQAEDAAERIEVEYDPLPPVVDVLAALEPGSPVIHPALGDNLAFERRIDTGDADAALATADAVVEARFQFGRHTGVTLETRAIVADWNEGEARLTVHQGTQVPHMMQTVFAQHLGLDEQQVRVVCYDVGGSFGIKIHVYGDEMATAVASRLLRRPVRFLADRLESFVTDIHARDHVVEARIAVTAAGDVTCFTADDVTGIGPFFASTAEVRG